jgi:hypothetical protein
MSYQIGQNPGAWQGGDIGASISLVSRLPGAMPGLAFLV